MDLGIDDIWARESYRVEWRDTDASGHHHNSLIMRLVEAVEVRIYRDLGVIPLFSASPRVQQVINFRALIYFDELAVTTVKLSRLGRTSMSFEFEVVKDPGDGTQQLVADGSFTTVHLPEGSQRAVPWPESIREAIASHRDRA